MKKLGIILLMLLLSSVALAETTDRSYLLGPGDKLHIAVWNNEDLMADVIILPDGTIFFPLVGQIKLEGLTIPEAQAKLTTQLAEYIRNPQLSLIVTETRTIEVKILGEVKNPGMYKIKPGSSATDVIAAAGGPTKRAELKQVGIFGANESSPRTVVTLGRRNRLNTDFATLAPKVLEGDTLYVPETKSPDWSAIFSYIVGLNYLKTLTE